MSPWRTLGISRTEDVAEIRRAYARKLKTIDVEADPDAFVALRQALDHALWEANDAKYREQSPLPGEESEVEAAMPAWAPDDVGLLEPAPAWEAAPAPPPVDRARFEALDVLLFPDDQAAPPPPPEALAAALRAILDHPDMERIDHSANVEHWLADTLYQAIPRSDPIIPLAIDHFRWDRQDGRWDQSWLIQDLVARRGAADLLGRLPDPAHPLHRAWRELTRDGDRLPFWRPGLAGEVGQLLGFIRQQAPDAEGALNAQRVLLWDERLAGGGIGGGLGWAATIFWVVFIGFKVLAIVGVGSSSGTAPPAPLQSVYAAEARADLDPIIRDETGNAADLAAIRAGNPELARRLSVRWAEASRRREPRYTFVVGVRVLLTDAAREGLRGGSYALQADHLRLIRDELAWQREHDLEHCPRRTGSVGDALTLPEEFRQRRRALRARAMMATVADPQAELAPGVNRSFPIPGTIAVAAARRSGLPNDRLGNAWQGQGTPADVCAANIALIEAALAAPQRVGAPLLRDMSAGF